MIKTVDSREFYDLMQAYRWADHDKPAETVAAFEAVKDWIRRNYIELASESEQENGTAEHS